jgi:hypothetical protein
VCAKSQSLRIGVLGNAFLGRASREALFVLIKGYIDESYGMDNDDPKTKIFTLSCAMSNVKGWAAIESSWKKCLAAKNKWLKARNRKPISRYHAADCAGFYNEFSDWNKDEQIPFVKDLLASMTRGDGWVNVVAYSMPMEPFLAEFPECADDPLPHCYSLIKLLMLAIVDQIRLAQRKFGKIKRTDIVLFHERCPYDGSLLNSFNKAIADETFAERGMFHSITPLGWETCTALQPADLVAYETFKDAQRQFSGRPRHKSLDFLLSTDTFGGRSQTFKPDAFKLLRKLIDEGKAKHEASGSGV